LPVLPVDLITRTAVVEGCGAVLMWKPVVPTGPPAGRGWRSLVGPRSCGSWRPVTDRGDQVTWDAPESRLGRRCPAPSASLAPRGSRGRDDAAVWGGPGRYLHHDYSTAGAEPDGPSRVAKQVQHPMVVGQHLTGQPANPSLPGRLDQPAEQQPAQPAALVAVGDRHGELGPIGLAGVAFQAGVGDELAAVGSDGDQPQAAVVVDL